MIADLQRDFIVGNYRTKVTEGIHYETVYSYLYPVHYVVDAIRCHIFCFLCTNGIDHIIIEDLSHLCNGNTYPFLNKIVKRNWREK